MKMHKKHFEELAKDIKNIEETWDKPEHRYEQLKNCVIGFCKKHGNNFDEIAFMNFIKN